MASLLNSHWTQIGKICLVILGCVAISGCTVSGKSASMDSTSRMPWLGLELKERKRNSDGPAFREIRSDKETKSRIDTLGLFGGTSKKEPKKVSMALPATDGSPTLESTTKPQAVELDFR